MSGDRDGTDGGASSVRLRNQSRSSKLAFSDECAIVTVGRPSKGYRTPSTMCRKAPAIPAVTAAPKGMTDRQAAGMVLHSRTQHLPHGDPVRKALGPVNTTFPKVVRVFG